jgi:hypothetical protein
MVRRVKRAAAIVGIGLAVQLGAALHWTPATFILSAAVGLPLVMVGSVLFLAAVWRNLKDRGAA